MILAFVKKRTFLGSVAALAVLIMAAPPNTAFTVSAASSASTSTSLLVNGDFESGQSPWSEASKTGHQMVQNATAHTGSWSALVCGYASCSDTLGQTFTIPISSSSLTLTFWTKISSPDLFCTGLLKVQIKNSTGGVVTTPLSLCDMSTIGWVQQSVNLNTLLSSAGQQLQLVFAGTSYYGLSYYVDDVALSAGGSASPTNTPLVQPTNTPLPTATSTPGSQPTKTPTPTATSTPVAQPTNTPTRTPAPTATSTPNATATTGCPGSASGCVQSMVNILNQDRASNGVAALTLNTTQSYGTGTCVGSIGHSQAMQQSGTIWHVNSSYPAASFPHDICISYWTAGENVGEDGSGNELTDLQQLNSLMMSEAHDPTTCATTVNHACNIINPNFHQLGVGIVNVNNVTWLTEDFTN